MRGRQAGLSAMEVLIAGFLGVILTVCGGYLFTTQVKGYSDIKEQARIQADMKKAMQVIVRQISNAGACLPDPRKGFSAGHEKLAFRYVDVKQRFCPSGTDTLTMSFYAKPGSKGDLLVQEIRCPGGSVQTHTLFTAQGGLDLTFNYQDKAGTATMDVSKIHAVELDLALRTTNSGGRPVRTREQTVRVNCPNLI